MTAKHLLAIVCLTLAGTLSCSEGESLPDGVLGQPYRATVLGIAGQGLLHWAVASGALPDGLALSSRTGEVSGTPTKAGKFEFTVRITDSATPPQKVLKKLSIRILLPAAGGTPPPPGPGSTAGGDAGTQASDCLSRFARVTEWAGEVTITHEARWLAADGIERASAAFTATAPIELLLKPPPPNRTDTTYVWDGSGKLSFRYRAEYWRRRDLGPFPVQVWKEATATIALERIEGNTIPLKEAWIFMIHPLHPNAKNPTDGPCTYRFVVRTELFDIEQVIHDPDNIFGGGVEARERGILGIYLTAIPIPASGMVLKGSRKLALGPQGSSWISTFRFDGGHPEGVLVRELPGFKEPALATVTWSLTPSKFN